MLFSNFARHSFMLLGVVSSVGVVHAAQVGSPPVNVPAGYCIAAIHLTGNSSNNVFYKYDRNMQAGGVTIGHPLGYWDAKNSSKDSDGSENGGYFNLSVLLDKMESGNCLADIAMRSATRGSVAGPPAAVIPYDGRGFTFVDATFTPSQPYQTDRVSVAFFSQRATTATKSVVVGATLEFDSWCRGQRNTPPLRPNETCLGTWKGQGGSKWYALHITKAAYTPPAGATVASVTGAWTQVVRCAGCSSTQYQTQLGVTSGKSIEKGTETSKSLSVSIGGGVELESPGVKKSFSLNVTGTITDTQRTAIVDSFSSSSQTQNTVVCDKGSLWQWQTSVGLSNGETSSAKSAIFVCTRDTDSPPDVKNIGWRGVQ
jgi:hypothetical protein